MKSFIETKPSGSMSQITHLRDSIDSVREFEKQIISEVVGFTWRGNVYKQARGQQVKHDEYFVGTVLIAFH
jgi:hypothetical protein